MKRSVLKISVLLIGILMAATLFGACVNGTPPDTDNASDFGSYFYSAESWSLLHGSSSEAPVTGEAPVSLSDGSIKFYNTNHSVEIAETENRMSFMLLALNNWEIRFLATESSNRGYYFTLKKSGEGIYLAVSSGGTAELLLPDGAYEPGKWSRFDIEYTQTPNDIKVEIFLNRAKVMLSEHIKEMSTTVADGRFTFQKPDDFYTGEYFIVKVWDNETVDYLQLKPVSKRNVKDTAKVACVGDSITEGGKTKTYPLQLQEMLGSDYNVVNFGKSGRTMLKDGDMPYWENYCYRAAKLFVPDIMIVMLGSNDAKTFQPLTQARFEADLTALIEEFKELNSEVRVIINTSPKAHQTNYDITDANIVSKVLPAQKAVSEALSLELVDVYTWTANKAHLFGDGIHPNNKGNELIAKLDYFAITGEDIPNNFGADY